jgi:hypothetical protein
MVAVYRETLFQTRGPSHEQTVECIEALVDFRTACQGYEPDHGRDAEASKWKEKPNEAARRSRSNAVTIRWGLGKMRSDRRLHNFGSAESPGSRLRTWGAGQFENADGEVAVGEARGRP